MGDADFDIKRGVKVTSTLSVCDYFGMCLLFL